MTSIMTNASAMTALRTLQATTNALEQTQARISTGYRVAEASDNAAYWSIATTMRSDNKALSTVQDALGLGAAKVDTAYTGVNAAIAVVDEIKAKLVAAREPGVDRTKIQSEITALQGQLSSNAANSSFSGENWLSVDSSSAGYNAVKSIVSAFTRSSTGAVSIGTISIDTGSIKLFDSATDAATSGTGILDGRYDATTGALLADQSAGGFTVSTLNIAALTNSTADLTTLESYIKGVDNAISRMTTAASDLGAAKKRVNLQKDFVSNLMDAIDRGVGQLVDADMNKESTRLQALQVQQQLGIQSLSIANSNAQGILSLFK
ncbi:MAG: flagellin [Mesorhizobium sp.]|nr:flagellin [Mesorhizobium sp.]